MDIMAFASLLCVPAFILFIIAAGAAGKVPVFDAFVRGAKGGVGLIVKILPFVVGMIFAVDIFTAAGCFTYISTALSAVFGDIFPTEALPLALVRPFSGGAATGVLISIFTLYGPDSYGGRVGSVLMGSSETIFYTVSLYYGSVGVRKTRYTIPVSLLSELSGVIASAAVCAAFFGG